MELHKRPIRVNELYLDDGDDGNGNEQKVLAAFQLRDADGEHIFSAYVSGHENPEETARRRKFINLVAEVFNLHADLLEIVQELPQWAHHGQYAMTTSTLWKDTDKTWAQHIAEVLKKAGVA